MADYNKQTVAQLRQILKDRGIPSTGLTRKAQIIEKLEEADGASESPIAPLNTDSKAEEQVEENQTASEAGVPEVALAEAEGIYTPETGAQFIAYLTAETQAPPEPEAQVEPVPAATTDSLPETISHIDSDVPPPDRTQAIEQPAEPVTKDDEPGSIQPAGIFNPPPADPDEVVGPKVTEPADAEVEGERNEETERGQLPEAPGPAAEALRLAHHGSEAPRDSEDITMDEKPPSVTSNEQESVERPDLATGPENSLDETSRLNTEELEADSKKRKRRSDTPEMDAEEIRAKKHRQGQDPAPEVHLKEDGDVVMEQRSEEEEVADVQRDQTNGKHDPPVATDPPATEAETKRERKEKAARYKDLVKSSDNEILPEALTDDRPTVPAIHPVTSALYIRNFMRPLRPEPLRAHLVSIASPPSSSPDPNIVKTLFLDSMKTHALVLFSTKTAASRVRASLHGSIWPPEGMRKELWVDFIPEESVESWIKEEEDAVAAEKEARASGRPINPKRFEVVYPESSDGTVTAVFQEVGSSAPSNAPRGPRGSDNMRRPSLQQQHSAPTDNSRQNTEASFKTLHELFESTQAKPQLFYLPVSDEISEMRLKELDAETSRDWTPGEIRKGRGIKTEMKYKYSFDDDDRIVEVGEDRGPWSEGYRGGRGGFRGRRGGRFRSRGGDLWRG